MTDNTLGQYHLFASAVENKVVKSFGEKIFRRLADVTAFDYRLKAI